MAISNCVLCKWLLRWLAPKLTSGAGNCISDKSTAWEWVHSNDYELWEREPDTDRLKQADALGVSDPAAAFEIYRDLAEQGSIRAMHQVAWQYGFGKGKLVAPDYDLAADWYIKAISAGSWMATRYYAQFLAMHRHFAHCEAVLQDGVTNEWVPAFFWLAWYRHEQSRSRKTYREIEPLLGHAAQHGHPFARLLLARLMSTGKFGLRKIPRGIRLYREQIAICVAEMDARAERARTEQPETAPVAA